MNRTIPFAKVTIPLIIGIILEAYFFSIIVVYVYLFCSFSYLLFSLALNNSLTKRINLSLLSYLLIICSGAIIANQQRTLKQKNNLDHTTFVKGIVTDTKKVTDSTIVFEFIVSQYKRNSKWHNTISHEKILVRYKKTSLDLSIKDHHCYLLKGHIKETSAQLSPNDVDYKKIYTKKGINYFLYTNQASTLYISNKQSILQKYKSEFITYLRSNLDQNTSAFISALIANEKEYISSKLKKKITRNGISHLIAISGLHVGIIYLLLNFLANLIPKTKQNYRNASSLCICLLLILYGSFCGFSPSIARSVTMFCVMQIAQLISRRNNAINSLFVSAFLLLIIQPSELFQVGFQLSFAGVLGILFFYQNIVDWLKLDNIVSQKLWDGFSVTIAAQLGVLPLLLFYFQTFSVNGIMLSIVLTYITMFLVGFSLLLVLLFKVALLNSVLLLIIEWLSTSFFSLLNISELFPLAIEYSGMTLLTVTFSYCVIFIVFRYNKKETLLSLKRILVSLIVLLTALQLPDEQNNLYIYNKEELTLQYKNKSIYPLKKSKQSAFPEISFIGNRLVSIDHALILFQQNKIIGNYPEINILILSDEIPLLAIKKIQVNQIIFDTTISKEYISLITPYLNKRDIYFHSIRQDGYFTKH